ncbi:MAG: 4-hydroxy-tetrahydrodipicolinate synthase [Deltaproteobacteria bacterium]|nr:4-hydroxy-tetrahydrodipicolinate synthase [Deltaproteobacteria bacterium]
MAKDISSARLITALKTPYLSDGSIDFETYDYLLDCQIRGGVDGVLVAGTTGEGHLMSSEEIVSLAKHAIEKVGNQVLVVVNSGGNDTKKAKTLTEKVMKLGADLTLQINPYYGKTSERGLFQHFKVLFDIAPGIIYNVPGRTAQDILPTTMHKIAEHKNFVGVKECMGSERIKAYVERGIRCWSGNDDTAFDSRHNCGATGVISVVSNIVPALIARIMDKADKHVDEQLQPLFAWAFCEPNPIALNTCLAMTGATKPVFRLPYVPLTLEQRRTGLAILEKFDSADIVGKRLSLMEDSDFIVV